MADLSILNDAGAEGSAIATLIYHPEFILHTDYLKARYFYNVENGCIYWAIQELYKAGIDRIDAINLTNMLNSNGAVKRKIEEYNMSDMQEFISMAQYAARHTLEEYKLLANTIIEMSFKRELTKACIKIQQTCLNSDQGLRELNTLVNKEISGLLEEYLTTGEIEPFGNKIDDLDREIDENVNDDGTSGLVSKIPLFNNYFTYEKGEVVLIKAKKKDGKSALCLNEAIDKLMRGVPTVYFDTEMADKLFYMRLMANLTGFNFIEVKTRSFRNSPEKVRIYNQCKEWVKKQPFVHIYLPSPSKEEIYATCKILKYKMNLQFVVYDYIKMDEPDTGRNYNLLGDLTNFLKNTVSGELELATLAAAQLNREGKTADSDKIERYISTTVLWRPKTAKEMDRDGAKCGNYAACIDVNRNGERMDPETEYIDVQFSGNKMRISQAEQQHAVNDNPFEDSDER